jgi:hypothetical protein
VVRLRREAVVRVRAAGQALGVRITDDDRARRSRSTTRCSRRGALPARRTTGFPAVRDPPARARRDGIRNGDTVRAIDGNAVGSVDEAIELLPQIADRGRQGVADRPRSIRQAGPPHDLDQVIPAVIRPGICTTRRFGSRSVTVFFDTRRPERERA